MFKDEYKQKFLETIILLILGDLNERISILHIQKEIFLLWNFDSEIKKLYNFIKHYKGPYLDLINESAKNPFFHINCWEYSSPNEDMSGGYLEITDEGYNKFIEITEKAKNIKQFNILHIMNAINILNRIYAPLDFDELLLLIYVKFPDFTEKSEVYEKLISNKEKIAKKLLSKNHIDEEKYEELLKF